MQDARSEMSVMLNPILKNFLISARRAARAFSVSWNELTPADQRGGWVPMTSAGADVTATTAMRITAVYACVRVLSEAVASLPLHLYRRVGDGKQRATDHPAYRIMHARPNGFQTSFGFRELLQAHAGLRGNGYAYIDRDIYGLVRVLPLHPERVRPKLSKNYEISYEVRPFDGGMVEYPADRILHIPGLTDDGITGLGPLQIAREAIGASIAAEEFSAKYFANGTAPMIALRTDQAMGKTTEEARKNREIVRDDWQANTHGVNLHRPPVLDRNLSVEKIGIAPEDAQLLETRNFNVVDIARIFKVQPHKIAHLLNATFSNIEHQAIEFVVDTLLPWLVRWEQALSLRLLNPDEQQDYFFQFNVDGLLRGDIKSRYEAYQIGIMNGWLCQNEVRGFENMNPIPNGDIYLRPLNLVPLGTNVEPASRLAASRISALRLMNGRNNGHAH